MGAKLKSSTGDKDHQIKVGNAGNTEPKVKIQNKKMKMKLNKP